MTKEQWLKKIEDLEKKVNQLEELEDSDYKELSEYIEELEKKVTKLEKILDKRK